MSHSTFAPSAMHILAQCAASRTRRESSPREEQTPEAAEGDAAHWVAAEGLRGRALPPVGSRAPNAVAVTPDMHVGADMIIADVEREIAPYGMQTSDGQVEQMVRIPRVHALCYGTPDYRIWIPAAGARHTLLLYDFKFGHRIIDAFENLQLVAYASGCVSEIVASDLEVNVRARIVQPRAFGREGPIRRWDFPAVNMRALVNLMSNQAHASEQPNPRARTGPACMHCEARGRCPELQRAASAAVEAAGVSNPVDLPAAAAGIELSILTEAAKRLDARITGLREIVSHHVRSGAAGTGWALEHSPGRLKWAVDAATAVGVGDLLGFDLRKPLDVITPTQAAAKGLPQQVLDAAARREPGGLSLTPVTAEAARRVFG